MKKCKGEKVFAAFIDLQKAFDSVWHEGLMHKLMKYGVNGDMLNLLRDMYTGNSFQLKFKDGFSNKIQSSCGVKQGDTLSPLLFNIYINDLVECLQSNPSCNPIKVGNSDINILLFADDIVLLSDTKNGLQHCLDTLSNFC